MFLPLLNLIRKLSAGDAVSSQNVCNDQIAPLGLPTNSNPKEDPRPCSHELLSIQLVRNTAYMYVGSMKHPPSLKECGVEGSTRPKQYNTTPDEEKFSAVVSGEWESQYSKLSYNYMELDPTNKKDASLSEAYGKN